RDRSEIPRVRGEQPRQPGVDLRIAGDDVARLEIAVRAVEIADAPAGLADDQRAGGDVPLAEAELPEPVDASGRDVAEVERRRARAPHARGLEHDRAQHLEVAVDALVDRKSVV